jgi:hypothetical protein
MSEETVQPSKGDKARREANEKLEKELVEQREAKKEANQEQPIVVNDLTSNILERHGYNDITAQDKGDKGDQESTSKKEEEAPAVNTIEQATDKDEEVTFTDEDFDSLEAKGITEADLEGKTMQEIKELAQGGKEIQAGADTSTQGQAIITDEQIEQLALVYPFAKSLKGKTLNDVMEIVTKQNQYITQLEQQRKEPVESTKQSKNNKPEEEIEEITELDLLNLSPEEQIKKLKALVRQELKGSVKEEVSEVLPDLTPLEEQAIKTHQTNFYNAIKAELPDLPEGVTPEKVFADWKADYSKDRTTEQMAELAKTPDTLITLITTDYQLRQLKAGKKEVAEDGKEVKLTNLANARKLLINSNKLGSGAKFNFKRKSDQSQNEELLSEEGTASEIMAGKILARNLPRS